MLYYLWSFWNDIFKCILNQMAIDHNNSTRKIMKFLWKIQQNDRKFVADPKILLVGTYKSTYNYTRTWALAITYYCVYWIPLKCHYQFWFSGVAEKFLGDLMAFCHFLHKMTLNFLYPLLLFLYITTHVILFGHVQNYFCGLEKSNYIPFMQTIANKTYLSSIHFKNMSISLKQIKSKHNCKGFQWSTKFSWKYRNPNELGH